ncbi:phosphatase PAP2 family protein [Nocardioides sp.]|uniref:phosphatase PAP2 family protein n=1 Tax=Nocardioides sp. TaxID=35761 RepID=UPI002D0635C1|nr:phosphatase PAP2 family protein [Nocardioides sp.]HVX54094.1 phosphatase PAP2 family protein [Nocardioides sp.]
MTARGAARGTAAGALSLFLVLCYAVHTGPLVQVDLRARYWFLPPGRWGTPQRLEDVVVNLCQPTVTGIALGLVAAISSLRRRSPWPLVAALGLIALATSSVVVVKHTLAIPDIHGSTAHLGGSFPSGHMVGIVCFGGGIVLLRGRRLLGWLALAVLTTLVASCLLLTAVHWVTDVAAGALLGTALLALAAQLPLWRPAAGFSLRPASATRPPRVRTSPPPR